MCWQGFVRFHCGHIQLTEDECEYARELALPFWLKVDCPYYRITHQDAGGECGQGSFYCAETHDGHYLDMVVKHKVHSEHRLAQLDAALRDKLDPWEATVIRRMNQQYSNHHEVTQAYATHPHILKIESLRHDIRHEWQNVCAKLRDADTTLYYCSEFFKLNAFNARGAPPPLPGYLRQFGLAGQPILQRQRQSSRTWLTNPCHGPSNVVGASRVLQERTNLQAKPKPHRASKQTPPVEAPVRRSARGKKQVNYADDDLSEGSSPANSEGASPTAPASSLKDMILEQRQRDAARLKTVNRSETQDGPKDGSTTPDTIVLRRAGDPPSPRMPHSYDKLRQSFAKQVNLTPTNLTPPIWSNPSTVQYTVPTAMMGSPLKRKVSSSPALPSNKRLQLGWPSGENAPPLSASSPPPFVKMERTDSGAWNAETVGPFQPSRAPTASMMASAVQPEALRGSNGMPQAWEQHGIDAPPQTRIKSFEEDLDDKFAFSDIDWVDDSAGV